jgi:UDP-N-acetylglucosamine enolpyruvyl transferase
MTIILCPQIGDIEELDDIVKYLELEQQFSTKKTKVCEYTSRVNSSPAPFTFTNPNSICSYYVSSASLKLTR